MTITNGYATLAETKAAMRIADTVDDSAIEVAISAASRMIDNYCGRKFWADTAATARKFDCGPDGVASINDCLEAPTLVKTDDGTRAFATTVASTDYELEPVNAVNGGRAWPYVAVVLMGDLLPVRFRGRTPVQVTAKWGWPGGVPDEVRQACIVQAIALFKAVDAPLGIAGFGDMGGMRLKQSVHPTAAALLTMFRRTVGIA